VIAAYREGRPDRPAAEIWEAARTDAVLRVPALRVADAHTTRGSAVFVYRFEWEAPGIGAAHAVDVPFTFGTFDRDGWAAAVGAGPAAEALGATATRPTMCFGAECRLVHDPDGATRAVWMRFRLSLP
jgi:carboxylesterase type B